MKRGSATCPCCGYTTPVSRVREQLKTHRGGADDARLLCVVTTKAGEQRRNYRLPTNRDLSAFENAKSILDTRRGSDEGSLALIPDEKICLNEIRRISLPLYGMESWGEMFNARQALALSTIARLIRGLKLRPEAMDESSLPIAVRTLLAFALDRLADSLSTSVTWTPGGEFQGHTFTRQALAFVSDFAEVNPWCESSGNWLGAVEWVCKVCEATACVPLIGHVDRASATSHPLPSDCAEAIVTDPPYYDAVPYSHLSDFFYVWLRRSVGAQYPELFATPTVAKEQEIVVDRPHELSNSTHDIAFYERELTKAFAESKRVTRPSGVWTDRLCQQDDS